jgi:hypothetical protein
VTHEEWLEWWYGSPGGMPREFCGERGPASQLICLNPKRHSGPHQGWTGKHTSCPIAWGDIDLEVEEGL